MNRKNIVFIVAALLCVCLSFAPVEAGAQNPSDSAAEMAEMADDDFIESDLMADSDITMAMADSLMADPLADDEMAEQQGGAYQVIKRKFIEGNAGFMSLVALALVLGLAFCIERIIYLTLSEVDCRKLLDDVEGKVDNGDIEGAKDICRNTPGPVASVCYQALARVGETPDSIERSMAATGTVQAANLEKGCSWITLFIAIAPSLGFLGTVIGMVMAFDQIQGEGDISPTIVAAGMKVALITTIFGIIVAVVLQVFYNYILSKIERLVAQMEDAAICMMDILSKRRTQHG